MARIRHIAIGTRDPEATARFYIEGLGLKQVGTVNTPTSEGYYLSDGHVNLAILKFKYDDPATTEGAPRYTGLHHFGVEVNDMAEARARQRRGQVHGAGRRDGGPIRARLARHQVISSCGQLLPRSPPQMSQRRADNAHA